MAAAVFRRALPSVTGQIALVLVGLTGGAVAVEKVFAIPGLGRAVLGAERPDVPAVQAGVLALLASGLPVAGTLSTVACSFAAGAGPLVREPSLPPERLR